MVSIFSLFFPAAFFPVHLNLLALVFLYPLGWILKEKEKTHFCV
jgi:hypothetical protein